MKLSLHSEYALLTLIYLARINQAVSATEIAALQQIPAESLVEILSAMRSSGYIAQDSTGSQVQLAKSPVMISVGEIIRLFDGALAPLEPVSSKGYAPAPMDREEKLSGLFEQIQEQIIERLENTTIAEMA
ncbi:MAG: Rrf2 family transcriptional regulator [Chloroflexi bacterium]|nr:Rrf2 family transcriptional regulator [Chloroflexota bacterium]